MDEVLQEVEGQVQVDEVHIEIQEVVDGINLIRYRSRGKTVHCDDDGVRREA